jgi:dephospho-CoA kinase
VTLSVALTGNIASGKSTVLDLFRSWGATVIDLDVLAREAVAPGTPALAAIAARFGRDLVLANGTLDRAALRRRVMGDKPSRDALNAIVHPEVMRRAEALGDEARRRGDPIVVLDIPLLFEVMDPSRFDAVVLVDAPPDVRRARIVTHRGLTPEEADVLLAAQQPSVAKRARSDWVIDNDGALDTLEARAGAVWQKLVERARQFA